jgi:polysaccharide biosynthesis transport protein
VPQGSETFSLEQALGVLRRRAPLLVLCIVVVAGAAYGYSKEQTKKYKATASLAFSDNPLSQQIAGLSAVGSSNGSVLAQQASNVELVRLGDMAAKTAALLGEGLSGEKVASSVSVSPEGESTIVDVSATATSPRRAAAIANTYTAQFVKEQQAANHKYFKSALALVHKQIAALSPKQRVGVDGLELQNRAQTLGLLGELNYGDVQIAEEATLPSSPSSPKTSTNTALGILLGLLIGLGLAFVLERLDRRIRGPEQLESIYGLPMLGVVPESSALSASRRRDGTEWKVLPPAEGEAFNLIRAHLRFFNVDRDLRTIMIASAAPGDGKTTIACHLAEAATMVGARVLLLEVDLRQPTLAKHLDITAGPGLADALIGAVPMSQATQSIELEIAGPRGGAKRTLDVLAAGAVLPPNPAELLESRAMDGLLHQARSSYDLIVIDTPPLTAVSDAFPLLTKVDGVVLVGWIGRSRSDDAERLRQVIADSGAPLLGVIANGSKSGVPEVYKRAEGTQAPPTAGSVNGAAPSPDALTPPPLKV